jgi:hypothetical protein
LGSALRAALWLGAEEVEVVVLTFGAGFTCGIPFGAGVTSFGARVTAFGAGVTSFGAGVTSFGAGVTSSGAGFNCGIDLPIAIGCSTAADFLPPLAAISEKMVRATAIKIELESFMELDLLK